jgi:hypothetical protein
MEQLRVCRRLGIIQPYRRHSYYGIHEQDVRHSRRGGTSMLNSNVLIATLTAVILVSAVLLDPTSVF